MVIIILLLILVVLLFGSSAIIGILGWIIGFIVAAGALIYASITFDMAPIEVLLYGIGGFIALIGCILLVAYIADRFNPELQESLRESERMLAKYSPEQRREIEKKAKHDYKKILAETKERLKHEKNN